MAIAAPSFGFRTCARCGVSFASFSGREYACPDCRKPRASAPRAGSLTCRERQVVALVAEGKANKQIAWELRLVEGTVKEYLYWIFRKTGATNRTELANIWRDRLQ